MDAGIPGELWVLLGADGSLIAYEEKGTSWAGALVFSSAQNARDFCAISGIDAREIASLAADRETMAPLVRSLKPRSIRYLLLDLDYRTGKCVQIEFEGDALGASNERQFVPPTPR